MKVKQWDGKGRQEDSAEVNGDIMTRDKNKRKCAMERENDNSNLDIIASLIASLHIYSAKKTVLKKHLVRA